MSATETPRITTSSSVAELIAYGFPPAVAAALAELQQSNAEARAWAAAFGGVTFGGPIPTKIAGAMVAAQRETRAVGKTGEAMGYSYTKMEDLIDSGRGILNGAGLALIPGSLLVTRFEVGERRTTNYTCWRAWCVVHESGESYWLLLDWPLYLQSGKRSRDKAVAVADTTMLGYLYRDLLAIPRLGEDQMDARDDRGTTEPGIAQDEAGPHSKKKPKPSAPSSSKPAAPAKPKPKPPTSSKPAAPAKPKPPAPKPEKPAAKPPASSSKPKPLTAAQKKKAADEKVAAAKKKKADQAKARRAAKKKKADDKPAAKVNDADGQAADDEAEDAAAEDAAEREAIQGEATDAERDEHLRLVLATGVTPRTTNVDLTGELPVDPSAADLEGSGWPVELAEELEGYGDDEPVKREALNVVTRKAAELMGLSFKAAKPMLVPAFSGVGVELKKNQVPNGYQLRLWCLAVAGIAAAHADGASA